MSKRLGTRGINILALSLAEGIDHGYVRMVLDRPEAACSLLAEEGCLFFQKPVLLVWLGNRPGALGALCDVWSKAGINIEYAYGSTRTDNVGDLLIVKVNRPEDALRAACAEAESL